MCVIFHMLVEVRENSFHVGLVKIPSNNENVLSVSGLQLADVSVENTHSLLLLALGGTYTAVMMTTVNSLGR